VLAGLLELDREGGGEALRPGVERELECQGAALVRAVAVAEWRAGARTERLAIEERRRGLPGLGAAPARGGAEPRPARPSDSELARRADQSMLHWETLQRLEDEICAAASRAREAAGPPPSGPGLGETFEALLAGVAPAGALDRGEAGVLVAFGPRLVERKPAGAESLARTLGALGVAGSGVSRPAVALLAARCEILRGRAEHALPTLDSSIEEHPGRRWAAHAWQLRARTWRDLRGAPHAFQAAIESAVAARALRDRRLEAGAMLDLSSLYRDTGRPEAARALCGAALENARRVGARELEGTALGNLANVNADTGSVLRAMELFEQAREIFRRLGDRRREAIATGSLGCVHWMLGDRDRTRALFEAALRIQRQQGDLRVEGVTLDNLGQLHREWGSFGEAQHLFDAALRIHQRLGNRQSEGRTLGNLANMQLDAGAAGRARELYEAALAIHREVGDRPWEGRALANMGTLQVSTGDADRGRGLLEAALEIHREVEDRASEGKTLQDLARFHAAAGRPARARELYRAALRIHRQARERYPEGRSLAGLARVELELGETAPALEHCRAAHAIFSELGALGELPVALHTRALCLVRGNAPKAAMESFRAALRALEQWLRDTGSERRRSRVLEDAFPCLFDAVALLLRGSDPGAEAIAEAFELAERCKARSLLEKVRRPAPPSLPSTPIARRRRELEAQLQRVRELLLEERSGPRARRQVLEHLESELDRARAEHGDLLDRLALRRPVCAAGEGLTPPLPLAEVQRRIVGDRSSALLEYLVTPSETFLWVIRADRVRTVRLGMGEAPLARSVDRALRPFARFRQSRIPAALCALDPARLRHLARLVLGPARAHLEGVRRLLVVPSGPLHALPFDLLVLRLAGEGGWKGRATSDRYAASEYLAERFEVVYGPSATLLDPGLRARGERDARANPPPASPAQARVLAFADPLCRAAGAPPEPPPGSAAAPPLPPLPGTREELRGIEELFPRTQSYSGSRARADIYRRHAPEADIIHLGCHGLIDADQPSHSAMALAPGRQPPEEGCLRAYQIAELHLPRAPLVVLSACGSAGDRLCPAEGPLGLIRAFAEAGASSVVAARWAVDDSVTARLMTLFYRALVAGRDDPAAALASAKRAMLAAARGSPPRGRDRSETALLLPPGHPYFWAGFGIYGQGIWCRGLPSGG